ncbi:hypothetical protein B6R96_21090 [Streptomyces sp. Sge12]|uniref:hypothetical protein n=2 Tax=unclassified Streptomyces TaxID=2593676 RepID=UPI0009C34814|nr:hypothetical protein [Streptomyces sp. Sge12]ARE76137.1 hypothetical protein B6R96_21090 [Streptomyces sp. Sge12]
MPTDDSPQITAKQWQDCTDVYDFLEQVRLRPGMWLPGHSLSHLEALLVGYRVALGVHAIDEPFDFWPEEGFTRWLHERRGATSSLSWAAEIERTTPADSTPVEEFFRLLDDYRRDAASKPAPSTSKARFPGIEYMGAMPVLWNSDEWLDADRRGAAADPRHEWPRETGVGGGR